MYVYDYAKDILLYLFVKYSLILLPDRILSSLQHVEQCLLCCCYWYSTLLGMPQMDLWTVGYRSSTRPDKLDDARFWILLQRILNEVLIIFIIVTTVYHPKFILSILLAFSYPKTVNFLERFDSTDACFCANFKQPIISCDKDHDKIKLNKKGPVVVVITEQHPQKNNYHRDVW